MVKLKQSIVPASCCLGLCVVLGCGDTGRKINRSQLSDVIKKADRIVVYENWRKETPAAFVSTNLQDMQELDDAIALVPQTDFFQCACYGTAVVRLYRGTNELVNVSSHHGITIRCSLWESDALLADPETLLRWFDTRHISSPRIEYEAEKARAEAGCTAYARWVVAMPEAVRSAWTNYSKQGLAGNLKPMRIAFAKAFPDRNERISALFGWYGSGAGPWSGFPQYEQVAENLLLEYPTDYLLEALEGKELSEHQLEGAARFFAGWDFFQQRPKDGERVPPTLRKTLLNHSLRSKDEDKLARAKNAFGE